MDLQHSFLTDHSSIKIGLHKGVGDGKKKAPEVTI